MSNLEKQVQLLAEKDLSAEQKAAVKLVLNKNQNLFIQGQAGSGKSTFIKYLQQTSNKNIILCSPTAVAALNIGGTTLHSLFRLPIMDYITLDRLYKVDRKKVFEVIQAMQILIIDEVSMVRPDILDAVDKVCRLLRNKKDKPFGGVQVILIGDLYQLPPVNNKDAVSLFKDEYNTDNPYFFDAHVYKEANFIPVQFTKVFRQEDKVLLKHLVNIREGKDINKAVDYFNTCKIKDRATLAYAVTITPYKAVADQLNRIRLNALEGIEKIYKSELDGVFEKMSDSSLPAARLLRLKEDALVIFNKNDKEKRWVNGTVGVIKTLNKDSIIVKLLSSGDDVLVGQDEWQNKEYSVKKSSYVDTVTGKLTVKKEIVETVTGTFKQYPLQLGYAMTIHKAQGKTLDKVNINLDKGAFAHGQLYVALSRTRKKEDMNVENSIKEKDVIFDEKVKTFLNKITKK